MKPKLGRILRKAVLLLLVVTSGSPFERLIADTENSPNTPRQRPPPLSWIGPSGIVYVLKAVPTEPGRGSEKEKTELQVVLKAQAARTPQEIEEAKKDQKFKIELLAGAVSPDFTDKNYPITFSFLNRVLDDDIFLYSTLQGLYKRHRPYQDHPGIKNLFADGTFGYPSGVATDSRMLVLVLAELFPNKGIALLSRDEVIAQSGVKAGAQYPSDIIAGRALATALIFVLQDNPGFIADMNKAKAEIEARTQPTNK